MNDINVAAYCSGDFGPGINKTVIADTQQSGITTVILWSMHLGRAGNVNEGLCTSIPGQFWGELVFNDGDIRITNGDIFNPNNDPLIAAWPGEISQLKQNGSSVDKIFISIGGDDQHVCDFRTIEYMLDNNMRDLLKNNFATLRTAFTVDGKCLINGFDLDNEENIKASTITDFSEMLFNLGFEVTFCPFSGPGDWQGYMQTLWDKGHRVSWWNLQCYSGGNNNLQNLQPWIDALSAVVGDGQGASYLVAGLAAQGATDSYPQLCPDGPSEESKKNGFCESLAAVSERGVAGGFMWTYDSILSNKTSCSDSIPTVTDYVKAIRDGLDNNCG